MPAALDVDRQQVKMLAISVGVREAARQMDLPEETVKKWCTREGWLKDLPRSQQMPPTILRPVPNVPNAANCLVNTLRNDLFETRASHVRIARRAASALEQKPDAALIDADVVPSILALGKHAALVGGWNADSRPDSPGKAFGGRNAGLEVDDAIVVTDVEPVAEASRNVEDY